MMGGKAHTGWQNSDTWREFFVFTVRTCARSVRSFHSGAFVLCACECVVGGYRFVTDDSSVFAMQSHKKGRQAKNVCVHVCQNIWAAAINSGTSSKPLLFTMISQTPAKPGSLQDPLFLSYVATFKSACYKF